MTKKTLNRISKTRTNENMASQTVSISCFRCKDKKTVAVTANNLSVTKLGRSLVHVNCPDCGRKMTTLITNDLSNQLRQECHKASEESSQVCLQQPEQVPSTGEKCQKATGQFITLDADC